MPDKYIWFDGIKFVRDDKTGYYRNSALRERLHRYIWKYYNGDIPKGYQVHHKDFDKSNNNIDNLMLVPTGRHEAIHMNKRVAEHYDEIKENLKTHAQPKAIEWHKSDKGREWHRKHYEVMKDKLYGKIKITCEYCGKEFYAINNGKNKFCSNRCKSAWRRKEGLDNETRMCEQCGKEFTVNKYSKTRFCSRACAKRYSSKLRKDKKD